MRGRAQAQAGEGAVPVLLLLLLLMPPQGGGGAPLQMLLAGAERVPLAAALATVVWTDQQAEGWDAAAADPS